MKRGRVTAHFIVNRSSGMEEDDGRRDPGREDVGTYVYMLRHTTVVTWPHPAMLRTLASTESDAQTSVLLPAYSWQLVLNEEELYSFVSRHTHARGPPLSHVSCALKL